MLKKKDVFPAGTAHCGRPACSRRVRRRPRNRRAAASAKCRPGGGRRRRPKNSPCLASTSWDRVGSKYHVLMTFTYLEL